MNSHKNFLDIWNSTKDKDKKIWCQAPVRILVEYMEIIKTNISMMEDGDIFLMILDGKQKEPEPINLLADKSNEKEYKIYVDDLKLWKKTNFKLISYIKQRSHTLTFTGLFDEINDTNVYDLWKNLCTKVLNFNQKDEDVIKDSIKNTKQIFNNTRITLNEYIYRYQTNLKMYNLSTGSELSQMEKIKYFIKKFFNKTFQPFEI